MKHFALFTFTLLFLASPAFALTSQDAGKFVASMDDVQALANQMEVEGKNRVIDARIKDIDPQKGFSPYVIAAKTLKEEFPADYKKLEDLTKKHGFETTEHWAETGDAVIEAYISTQMDTNAHANLAAAQSQMTPEMLNQMPAEAQARMKQGIALLQHISKVPQADRDAIAPYKPQIESFIQQQSNLQR